MPRDRPRESAAVPAHTPEPRRGDGVVPAVVFWFCGVSSWRQRRRIRELHGVRVFDRHRVIIPKC